MKNKVHITMISVTMFLLVGCQIKPVVESEPWTVNSQLSQLSFVTTKNHTITEEHTIQFKSGTYDKQSFEAQLDLNSVDTQIPIRDERLRNILFETNEYPLATITSTLPNDLPMNQPITLPFDLNLHGHKLTMNAEVIIQSVNEQLVVTSFEPVEVNAKDFALDSAINKLTQIAGLKSINYDISVDFKLTFEK